MFFFSLDKMIREVVMIFTVLLAAKVTVEAETNVHQIRINTETRYQSCNDTTCDCGNTESIQPVKRCNQACADARCKALTCLSGTCHQECHNCHMKCTSDVDYCRQRCLSGACSFTCNAKYCVQLCKGGQCISPSESANNLLFPREYLVLLAALFALVAILSFTLLVLLFCKGNCCGEQSNYLEAKTFSGSLDSLDSESSFV